MKSKYFYSLPLIYCNENTLVFQITAVFFFPIHVVKTEIASDIISQV